MQLRYLPLLASLVSCCAAVLGGASESGMEFGAGTLPGVYDRDYISPLNSSIAYLASKGMRVVRLPFEWARLQASLVGAPAFDSFYLSLIDNAVAQATGLGMQIVLDPHNYARYRGAVIGAGAPPSAADFAAFWAALATRYMNNPSVVFGIMNEPNTMATELWISDANAAIAAIRGVGATNLLSVPGNDWTGACSWFYSDYGTPNAVAMKNITDPLHNYVVELHLYFNQDHSGSSPTCTSADIGVQCLTNVTGWLRANGLRGFLGEFAGGANPLCQQAVTNTLAHVTANADAWWAWSWWAAGPWWGSYMYSIEPGAPPHVDKPQIAWLAQFLQDEAATSTASEASSVSATGSVTASLSSSCTSSTSSSSSVTSTSSDVSSAVWSSVTSSSATTTSSISATPNSSGSATSTFSSNETQLSESSNATSTTLEGSTSTTSSGATLSGAGGGISGASPGGGLSTGQQAGIGLGVGFACIAAGTAVVLAWRLLAPSKRAVAPDAARAADGRDKDVSRQQRAVAPTARAATTKPAADVTAADNDLADSAPVHSVASLPASDSAPVPSVTVPATFDASLPTSATATDRKTKCII